MKGEKVERELKEMEGRKRKVRRIKRKLNEKGKNERKGEKAMRER